MATTIGQILVNEALPPDFRDETRTLGKSETDDLLASLARAHPELYRDISHKLVELGRNAAFDEGTTLRLSDIRVPVEKQTLLDHVRQQEDRIRADKTMTPEEKQDTLEEVYGDVNDALKKMTYDAALARENPFALQVKSKARGNPDQLSMLLTTPGVYQDAKDRTIPVFINRSYAEGLAPHEYWAATYGARKGVISSKFATRQAGYVGKLFGMAVMDSVVTEDDCSTPYGIPVKSDDDDNVGSVLARPAAGFDAGTVIDKSVMAALKAKKVDEISVRSPITCGAKQGVCRHCVGIREGGKFPEIGYHIGLNAASALAEQIAQSSLNVKHCISSFERVLYSDWSVKQIKDVRVGDMVMGCGTDGHMRPVKVLNVFDNGPRECYRTVFRQNGCQGGEEWTVTSTLDHKILAMRRVSGQKEAALNGIPRQLPIGIKSKYFYAALPSSYDDKGMLDEPLALLLGNLLGDGCYTEAVNGVHLTCADTSQIRDLQTYLDLLELKLTKLKGHDYYYRVSARDKDAADRCGNYVHNYMKKQGMWGKYACDKTIPDVAWTWDNSSVAALIAGLVVTDGSIYNSDGKGKPEKRDTHGHAEPVEQRAGDEMPVRPAPQIPPDAIPLPVIGNAVRSGKHRAEQPDADQEKAYSYGMASHPPQQPGRRVKPHAASPFAHRACPHPAMASKTAFAVSETSMSPAATRQVAH